MINPTLHCNGSASQSCIVKVLNTPQFTVIEWMILSICQYLFIYLFTALTVKWHFNLPLILCKFHFFRRLFSSSLRDTYFKSFRIFWFRSAQKMQSHLKHTSVATTRQCCFLRFYMAVACFWCFKFDSVIRFRLN